MKAISSCMLLLLVFYNGNGNEGPLKVIEAKICDVKLYDYCEENCFTDTCVQKYGNTAIHLCNELNQCMCRYRC
ncbi:hypothetical protein AAZX31_17G215200 [Glycine max]